MADIKQFLEDMKKREELRDAEVESINEEMGRIDLRQETETERFITGIQEDRQTGMYNNITDGKMQQLIDEQIIQIEEKYNTQREELKQKLEEIKKKHIEEKANDYKQISSQIKDYHLDVVLETNEAQKELRQIELERDGKIQEIDNKIKQKEAEQTHLIMQNRKFMNLETNSALGDINALGAEIEKLKEDKDAITNEYLIKIQEKNESIQYYIEQKEKVNAFLGKIRLSEKSIDEIYDILFDEEEIVTSDKQEVPEAKEQAVEEMPEAEEQVVEETPEVEEQVAEETPKGEKAVEEEAVTNDIIEQGLKSHWDKNVDESQKYKMHIEKGTEYKHETIWDRLKKFVDEHQEELESEQAEEEELLEKEYAEGEPTLEKPVMRELVIEKNIVEELNTPRVTENIPEQEKIVKPIQSFQIKLTKDELKLKVIRKGDKIGIVRYDDLDVLSDEQEKTFEEFKRLNRQTISKTGNTIIPNEIARAVATEMLTFEEGQEQLKNYLALLNGEKKKEEVPLQLEYNLKGLQNSEFYYEEEKESIIKEAKRAKKLKIANVKSGFLIGAKWIFEDLKEKWNGFWDSRKALGKGEEKEFEDDFMGDVEKDLLNELEKETPLNPHRKFSQELGNGTFNVTYQPEENMSSVAPDTFFTGRSEDDGFEIGEDD